jgi:hypothetical protein
MKFRTEVEIPEFPKKMGYRHPSLMVGSCFAENIGTYFLDRCLPVMVNPFGILYNPISIANSLELLISEKKFTAQDLFYSNGLYHSFSHHSRFSDSNSAHMLDNINNQATEATQLLKNAGHLFLTFGTAWVFQHQASSKIVSNCHKLPSATFYRYRLTVSQIVETWVSLIGQLRQLNPNLHLVFTVSPIRHLKDGAHENQLSKSTLLMALETLHAQLGNDLVSYFPSYELLLDELRDYRFYAADMTHPSEVATEFIREKFVASLLDQEARNIASEVAKLLPALRHIPVNPGETGYISFIESQIAKMEQLRNKYPFVDFSGLTKKFQKKRTD